MPNTTERQILDTAIRTVIFLSLAVFVSQFAYHVGFENLKPRYIINFTLDVFGMVVGYILLIGLFLDKRKKGNASKVLAWLIVVAYIGLFADAIEYLIDGIAEYRSINIWITTLYYMTIPAEGLLFWHYTIGYLRIKNSRLPKLNLLATAGFVLAAFVRLLNVKYGFYFTIDEKGVYTRSSLYGFSKAYFIAIISFSLFLILTRRKQFSVVQLISVFLYGFAPAVVLVIAILVNGLSLTPITTMIVTLFMYCTLNVTQGREDAVAENEITIASSIQENVLPKTFPYLPERKEFELYAVMKPAKEVGGDFYDFFMVDNNHLALVIADVSGKGIPAALFMMTSRTLIKNSLQAKSDLSEIVGDINNKLCEGNVQDLFVTAWISVIDLTTGKGMAVNAGHEYPMIKHLDGGFTSVEGKHGIALAMFEEALYPTEEFTLSSGDRIFVYTDGVTEAMNIDDEMFGKDRLLAVLNKDLTASPKTAIEDVLAAINAFAHGKEQFDDTTMLYMVYNGL